jgi:hypothetical protein
MQVRCQTRIVELFSEGLYASPNKAIEELVANSFDAGALRVLVMHSANMHDQDATIAVMDDGEGMGIDGLKQHWLIGVSNKRALENLPKGRQQIGQFSICRPVSSRDFPPDPSVPLMLPAARFRSRGPGSWPITTRELVRTPAIRGIGPNNAARMLIQKEPSGERRLT